MNGQPQWVHYFSDPPVSDRADERRAQLGGKGAGLNEMTLAGLNVPPGFTISTLACAEFFRLGRQWPPGLEEEVRKNLQRLERKTGTRFGRGEEPLLVSVRSGAAVSMPGMMDTILNCGLNPALAGDVKNPPVVWRLYADFIRRFAATVDGIAPAEFPAALAGEADARKTAESCLETYHRLAGKSFPTDPWDLLKECIGAVFESWNSERARVYRRRHDIRGLNGTAVNVQCMFPSRVSGVVFTRDPNRSNSGRIVIEASYGLGEAVVSGDVTPDRFLVGREDNSIETFVGHKHVVVTSFDAGETLDPDQPSLEPEHLLKLRDLALKVEAFAGFPVDIEFGFSKGVLALLQYRKIKGLDVAADIEPARQEEIARLRILAGQGRRCWVAHNLSETLRAPTPLTWDIVRDFMSGSGGFGQLYRKLGYRPSSRICNEGFLELIAGRIYSDPERQAELFWDGIPLRYDVDRLIADPGQLNGPPTRFVPEKADGRFLAMLPVFLGSLFLSARRVQRARHDADRVFKDHVLPGYLDYVKQKRNQDLTGLADEAVVKELHDRRRRVLYEFAPESLLPGFAAGVALDALTRLLTQVLGPEQGPLTAVALTQSVEPDTTFAQNTMLKHVAEGSSSLPAFLEEFGHRGVGEMELAEPRWREDATYLEQVVARLRRSPGRTPDEARKLNLEKRNLAEEKLRRDLELWGASSLREDIEADLADARRLLPYRETGKHYLMMGYELIRTAIEELARRWDVGRDIYFLRLNELGTFVQQRVRLDEAINQRKIRWQAFQRLDMPEVIDSGDLDSLGRGVAAAEASEFSGQPISPGLSTGTAQVIFSPQEATDMEAMILVCPSTDPAWTPLFLHAKGLVVERGGVLSHGAIVARDFGIPAVALSDATRLFHTGDTLKLDGHTGRVAVIKERAV